ncbi:hypothetical protein ABZZ48_40710 [Kitasatospora indigofera]
MPDANGKKPRRGLPRGPSSPSAPPPASQPSAAWFELLCINRGYEDLAERLNSIGAQIEIFRDI